MNNKLIRPVEDVPIVGQQLTVFEVIPLVTARCNCREDNLPFVVKGTNLMEVCRHCKTVYGIVRLAYDRERTPEPIVVLAQLGKATEEKVN